MFTKNIVQVKSFFGVVDDIFPKVDMNLFCITLIACDIIQKCLLFLNPVKSRRVNQIKNQQNNCVLIILGSGNYDIALIKMNKPVVFTNFIR